MIAGARLVERLNALEQIMALGYRSQSDEFLTRSTRPKPLAKEQGWDFRSAIKSLPKNTVDR